MTDRRDARVVYSTSAGRICPDCGAPVEQCRCSLETANEPVPSRIVAKLRLERKGRGGKSVTVVDGLPRNAMFLKELCHDLKRAAGCGGTVQDGAVELQGDLRDRVRDILLKRSFVVKG